MLGSEKFLDFVYIGAPRAGSTWLAAAFNEHPELWAPPAKELNFFNDRSLYPIEDSYHKGIGYYRSLFAGAPDGAKLGDMSPLYYIDPMVAHRLYTSFPDVNVIAMIRNPADVMFSQYLKRRLYERREKTFGREIEKNPQFLDLGFYHRNLTPFFDWFSEGNIWVGVYERFFEDKEASLASLYRFLDVDASFRPSVMDRVINKSAPPNPEALTAVTGLALKILNNRYMLPVKRALRAIGLERTDYRGEEAGNVTGKNVPALPEETRRRLMDIFEPDMRRLERDLSINLDVWRVGKHVKKSTDARTST